jgi:hypothetical protein
LKARGGSGGGGGDSLFEKRSKFCSVFLCWNFFLFRNNMTNKWIWKRDPHEGYSVEGVYHTVNQNKQQDHAQFTELIWNKAMPLKCLFLRGELYIRGFRPKTIWLVVWLFIQDLCCVLVVVGKKNLKSFILQLRLLRKH